MIKLALVQEDFLVGDIGGNLAKALDATAKARRSGADLVLFPELALSGYPPEDLILRPGFMRRSAQALEEFVQSVHDIDAVIGHPWEDRSRRFNAISWIREGRILGRYFKQLLPNYAVFDERRYFSPGSESLVIEVRGCPVGVLICEDAWQSGPANLAVDAGAKLLLIANASPYRHDKQAARERMLKDRHRDTGLPIVFCNLVGGQDELVFDGRSLLIDGNGELGSPAPLCEEVLLSVEFDPASGALKPIHWPTSNVGSEAEIYQVLTLGLRDYVHKNGFTDVVFGLSGGIDSALCLAITVDALGSDHVHTVMMPSRHTSGLSIELAQEQAVGLGVDHRCISIEPAFEALLMLLEPSFEGLPPDLTEENLQARARANIVMALSNKFGWLLITTSNKSEAAVGYTTIYGDMCGGFGPLLDCFKTRVYALAEFRNTISAAIPRGVIERPPSAELRPDQSDQDSLPPYAQLDQILERYIELDWSISRIVNEGFEEETVRAVAGMVLRNEYKRRQSAPGVRITSRAFGRDRRYPITSGWRDAAD